MDERPHAAKVSPEIYVYATNKNFLNVYDALRIEKIKIEVAGYDQGSGRQTGIASAWLDVDDARLLAHLITTRQFREVLDRGRFEKFGGSDRDGMVESRTLLVEWDPGQDGKFARYPYRITISNGPGQRTQNGAVQPKGEPVSRQSMRMPEVDMIKIMLAVGAYIEAFAIVHHNRIVADKVREVQEKLAGRAAARPVAAAPDDDAPAPAPVARPAAPPLRVMPPADNPGPRVMRPAEPSAPRVVRPNTPVAQTQARAEAPPPAPSHPSGASPARVVHPPAMADAPRRVVPPGGNANRPSDSYTANSTPRQERPTRTG